jgi:hypothetical protein
MALTAQSLILYGYDVDVNNRALDFKTSFGGSEKQASLQLGSYTLTGLMTEIARAMNEADPANSFVVTANRTYVGGTENKVTIACTSSGYLDLLFLSGSRNTASCRSLIGFNAVDYTGLTSYTGNNTSGVSLIPDYAGYNYLGPEFLRKVFGSVNISANGSKEAIVYQIQRFIQVEFKYEQKAKVISEWADFMDWAIQQKSFEFTPEITSPNVFYEVTLETSSDDSKGLGYKMTEMLPQFPNHYATGSLRFRQVVPPAGFI